MTKMGLTSAAALAMVLSGFAIDRGEAAAALSNRAWVSGHGVDQAGCGAPTSPCRTLQYVHDNIIADGGEIDVLDPAGYGPIAITKGISIVNDGVGTAGVQQATSGQNAITINTSSSAGVTLRGLNIDGLGQGFYGIYLIASPNLTITHCVVRHFTNNGIFINPNGANAFTISDTLVADNGGYGIDILSTPAGTTSGAIVRTITRNHHASGSLSIPSLAGIAVGSNANSGPSVDVTVVDSVSENNDIGYEASAGAISVGLTLRNVTAVNNYYGVYANGYQIMLSHSTLNGNNINVEASNGQVWTYGDNNINFSRSGNDIDGTMHPLVLQ